jgi:predicted metal-dependent RNase
VFLVHGEPRQSEILAQLLHTRFDLEAVCPAPGQSFELA